MSQDKIGRYELGEVLGSGSFATVWRAHDPVVGIDVALKVMGDNLAHDRHMRERFIAEGRVGMEANSSRMIRVHGVDETEAGTPYLVMALADRGSLADRVKEHGRFGVYRALSIGHEITMSVVDLHRRRLIHRDLKPANVLFQSSPDGEELLLGDFGLARSIDKSAVTMISGTPGYAAPEQAEGLDQLTEQADLYPIGLIMLELLTGEKQVRRRSMRATAEQGQLDVAAVLDEHNVNRPAALDELLQELLQRDPEQRPSSAAAVAERLLEIQQGGEAETEQTAAPQKQASQKQASQKAGASAPAAKRWPVVLAGVVVLAGAVLGAVLLTGGSDGDPTVDVPPTTTAATAIPVIAGDLSSVNDVPLPAAAVIDRVASEPGEAIVANVAGSVDDIVGFYESVNGWTVLDRTDSEATTTLLVTGDGPTFDVTLTPTALSSGSTTTNIVVRRVT